MYLVEKYQTMIAVPFFVVIYAVYEAIEKNPYILKYFYQSPLILKMMSRLMWRIWPWGKKIERTKRVRVKNPMNHQRTSNV